MADQEILTPDASAPVADAAPPAAKAPLAPAGNTVLDEGGLPAAPPPAGDDWRMQMAGADTAFAERLARFKSQADFAKSYRELEKKLSAGEHKKDVPAPGADAKPEEIAEWRKANGIPEQPDGYKVELPDGFVLGEADKPLVSDFTSYAHQRNWTPEKVNEAMDWYAKFSSQQTIERQKKDDAFKNAAIGELTAEWGPQDYYRNRQAVINYLDTIPDGLGRTMLQARDAEGRVLGSHPVFMKWLADQAFNMNPAGALVPVGTENAPAALAAEKAKIEQSMKSDMAAYRRNKPMQARYEEILAAEERVASMKAMRG